MVKIKVNEKSIKDFLKQNRWCKTRERAIKILNDVNENYRTGNYFTLEDLITNATRGVRKMEQTCKNCGTDGIKGDIPDGYQEVYICDNCGRYWDEDGNVFEKGKQP